MNEVKPKTAAILILAMIAIFMNVIAAILTFDSDQPNFFGRVANRNNSLKQANDFKTFSSENDFKNYLASIPKEEGYYGIGGGTAARSEISALDSAKTTNGFNTPINPQGLRSELFRVSQTNAQVIGIDEPDIVKTNGKEIYFSAEPRLYYDIMMEENSGSGITFDEQQKILPPYYEPQEKTDIIKAFPAADMALIGKIDKRGDLLLSKNILTVIGDQEITGFDIADPKSPKEKWNIKMKDNNLIIASRLYGNNIYLITRNMINDARPCPIVPFSANGAETSIRCQDIYHPIAPISTDSTFTALAVNTADGKVGKTVSFVGSSSTSVIYMSEQSIYAAYSYSESTIKFFIGFASANRDLFPASMIQKMQKLDSYDISDSSKMMEFSVLMEKYNNSLNADDRLKIQNETQNRMAEYYKIHKRELEKTGIVKIDLDGFKVAATGSVPGYLLNNFSMDEYQGNLRVAVTIGQRFGWRFGISGQNSQANDVYVLDNNMKTIGKILDLGKTEQIYSARFIEDKGYVVTFRQTDPFYVLDLSDPKNPIMAGELKIPGFSSYLHPLDTTHILGIGMDGGKVKISLFDVSDKNNPKELDKYSLDEYWTEVSGNYHAFLLDAKHSVFFLPGGKGGYVFSYINPVQSNPNLMYKLELKKAISQNSVKRAIYINDYLYIVGDDKIAVLNELDWQKVNELDLSK